MTVYRDVVVVSMENITVCSYADGREERMYDAQNWK